MCSRRADDIKRFLDGYGNAVQLPHVFSRRYCLVRFACGSQGILLQNDSHRIHDGVDSFNAVEVSLDHILARQPFFSNGRRQACSTPLPEGKMCGRTHEVRLYVREM